MNLFQILSCSSDLGNCCKSPSTALIINAIQNVMNIIQIIIPILLIVFAAIQITKLIINPEIKNGTKRIQDMFLSASIVFFIPIIVNIVLSILPNTFSITSCWKEAKSIAKSNQSKKNTYMNPYKKKEPSKFISTPGGYEKGEKEINFSPDTSSTTSSPTSSPTNNIPGGSAKGVLEGAEKVHTMYEQNGWGYYTDLSQLRWEDINYSTNNPSRKTCCATFVGSALFIGGVFSESEINQYNYNLPEGISDLCEAHGWVRINNYNQLAPGDIVIMTSPGGSGPGHVQIYAGNGTWYNAGSNQAIQGDNPYPTDSSARFLYGLRKPN